MTGQKWWIIQLDDEGRMFVSDNDTLSDMWHEASDEEKKSFVETGSWEVFEPKPKGK